jgi:predicted dehydrogenase
VRKRANRWRISRDRKLSLVPPTVPSGLPFNVAQLYRGMAEGIREGKSVSPDFDAAVKRHHLLDAIQKASDTGIPQIV